MTKFRFVAVALFLMMLVQSCGGRQANIAQVTPLTTGRLSPTQPAATASTVSTAISTATVSSTVTASSAMTPEATTVESIPTSVDDAPVLDPAVAPPTPPDVGSPGLEASQPARLIIPAIGFDAAPRAVGLDARRVPIVPKHEVGWFEGSAVPGQGSNVVFWGHVLRWKDSPNIPAPFARLSELQQGAEVVVVTSAGERHRYRVTQRVQVRPTQVSYVLPTSSERVTLVSCIGDTVIMNGKVSKAWRLIVIAEPVKG